MQESPGLGTILPIALSPAVQRRQLHESITYSGNEERRVMSHAQSPQSASTAPPTPAGNCWNLRNPNQTDGNDAWNMTQ